MTTERIIFSLNTGRCGTQYLYQIMDTVPDVCSLHEPPPSFHENWGKKYKERRKWLKEVKIPYILGLSPPIYFEASAQFSRGFVEPMLSLGYIPDVIVLRRNLTNVAMSLWRTNHIPGRLGDIANMYAYSPDHPYAFLKYSNYKHWTDYMCCYWQVLEMKYRMDKYSQTIKDAGGIVVETNIEVLPNAIEFYRVLNELHLPYPDLRIYEKIRGIRYNETPPSSWNKLPAGDIATQENWVKTLLTDKYQWEA